MFQKNLISSILRDQGVIFYTTNNMSYSTMKHDVIPFVPADMPNGCETGSCSLAHAFYKSQRLLLWRLKTRSELTAFYHATYHYWSDDLEPRSFSQVLYALVNDGRILRINKSKYLVWTDPDCPYYKNKKTEHSH